MRMWRVGDVMTTDVVTIGEDTPYQEIVDTLMSYRVSAAPVVESGRVVGVVSEADLLHKVEFVGDGERRRVFASQRRRHARTKANGRVARELMSAPAVTVGAGVSLAAAARLMDDEQVKRLPVVDAQGQLVGIVSRFDLLRVYLRPDFEIEQDVVEEVLRRTLWVDPESVKVQAQDGIVTLSGRTDRLTTKQLAIKLTWLVPGVVEVQDRLEFEYDDRSLAEAPAYAPNPFGAA